MPSIDLLPFQARASKQIAERYRKLASDERRPMIHRAWDVPFYQALAALTGAGKTPILADAVQQIAASFARAPIVLWISKARAVVDQTFANFESGGKYRHLVEGFEVVYLSALSPQLIADDRVPVMALATVGAFNQKEKGDGTLTVHKVREDEGKEALWSTLTARKGSSGSRRPLIIVYDEGHNLSDQQTELLLELEPQAILVASATMRTPARLAKLIQRLKDHGWTEGPVDDGRDDVRPCLVTSVSSKAVVEAGLVKRQILLGGYTALLEAAVDDLLDTFRDAERRAKRLKTGFLPKAIYVCRTNISQDDGAFDQPSRPFGERRAPPILIWRYLVEKKGIDPREIAAYCDLKFDRKDNPPPRDFVLFSGGDDDFAAFSAGNFRHIIFNQSLQEGWDDPSCCCAYIDKSMGSSIQVEQVIGRVLRQPGAHHFADAKLNTATFFIRIDNKQEFPRILKTVQDRVAAESPEVRIDGYSEPKERARLSHEPKREVTVPEIHIFADEAIEPLNEALRQLADFRLDIVNTVGKGELQQALQVVGEGQKGAVVTKEVAHSNRVMARWIVRREIQTLYPEVIKTIDWSDPRFDALVETTSLAAETIRATAEKLVDVYLEHCDLCFEVGNRYTVGPVFVDPRKAHTFRNAIHPSYSDLNGPEADFAEALDATKLLWARNPRNGGFSIPLLDKGDTRSFYPDFLVWRGSTVYALDPKGEHLIQKDAGRKLLNITDERGKRGVLVRLISEGAWSEDFTRHGNDGLTVWSMAKTGKVKARRAKTVTEAVNICLDL